MIIQKREVEMINGNDKYEKYEQATKLEIQEQYW